MHPADAQGLRVRPGSALVPRLRRLLDPGPDAEDHAGLRLPARRTSSSSRGIGCSGRLPYYMNTYGFHTIHGRAPTLATGLKAARPDLMVWVITGDGDAPQHRRQPRPPLDAPQRGHQAGHVQQPHLRADQGPGLADLGDGQAHEVQPRRARSTTRSSRCRSPWRPRRPSSPARSTPTRSTSRRRWSEPARHRGSAFVEVLQNCNIFNDGAYREFTDREVREDRMLVLEHGKPMIFGKDRDKGIRLRGLQPEVVQLGQTASPRPTCSSTTRRRPTPTSPSCSRACGGRSSRCRSASSATWPRPTHDQLRQAQIDEAIAQRGEGDLAAALLGELDGRRLRRSPMICPVCDADNIEGVGRVRQLRRRPAHGRPADARHAPGAPPRHRTR